MEKREENEVKSELDEVVSQVREMLSQGNLSIGHRFFEKESNSLIFSALGLDKEGDMSIVVRGEDIKGRYIEITRVKRRV